MIQKTNNRWGHIMKKILFVTDRNILTTSGELRLIKNRAESLFSDSGIITDFIAFARKARIENSNEVINAGGDRAIYPVALSNPLKTLKTFFEVRKEIIKRLKTKEYRAVILSGPVMISYAGRIKNTCHIPVIADIHGSFEDIVEFSKTSKLARKTALRFSFHLEKILLKKNKKHLEGFLVVTEALKEYIIRNYHTDDNTQFFIIPCATNTSPASAEEYLSDRKKYRKKYTIDDNEIVFIYSGGVSPWQCVDKTISLYREIADRTDRKTRLLVFSHHKEMVKSLAGNDDRIQIDSYAPDELMHVLHAGDFAFLLRENSITNNVAFPNKYLEYIQSGMRIITTPYINEVAKQVAEYRLGYLYDFNQDPDQLLDYIKKEENGLYREEDIRTVLKKNGFAETTQNFCKWYFSENG